MQEFFFTVLTIWVIWKIYNAFSKSSRSDSRAGRTTNFYQQNNQYYQKPKEGEIKVEMKKENKPRTPGDEGEYVDYEEIK
jgi:Domain of unknown function (DUF4834)